MNHPTDQTFLVGTDLVEFDRRDLPIYQTEQASWDCAPQAPYGAPLDRLFGEPGDVHVDGAVGEPTHDIAGDVEDPVVGLAAVSDGLALHGSEAPPVATGFDVGADAHTVVHLHDGWSWDFSGADWTFDPQT
jgi:hypothetical protein